MLKCTGAMNTTTMRTPSVYRSPYGPDNLRRPNDNTKLIGFVPFLVNRAQFLLYGDVDGKRSAILINRARQHILFKFCFSIRWKIMIMELLTNLEIQCILDYIIRTAAHLFMLN